MRSIFADAMKTTRSIQSEDYNPIETISYAVPVVRCDKCRHHYEHGKDIVCAISKDVVRDDDYCSYWEKKR